MRKWKLDDRVDTLENTVSVMLEIATRTEDRDEMFALGIATGILDKEIAIEKETKEVDPVQVLTNIVRKLIHIEMDFAPGPDPMPKERCLMQLLDQLKGE